MPIHEFRCSSCDYTFELLIMNREEMEAVRCPKCQSPEVDRLMSACNATVKGGGGGGRSEQKGPSVQQHTCESGSCTAINLPGHTR